MSTDFLVNQQQINHLIISETAKLISKSITTQEKIGCVLKLLAKWASLYYGRVLLPDFSKNELQVAYHYGLIKEHLEQGKYKEIRTAHETNERSAHEPKVSNRHVCGAHCHYHKQPAQPATLKQQAGQKRPWMLGH
jgi:hypothetical protein